MRTLTALIPLLVAFSGLVSGQTYTISTVAGGALPVNIPGTSASLSLPRAVAVDTAGNVIILDQCTVFRLDRVTGVLTLVAGNGAQGFSGDNGPATGAEFLIPRGVAVDASGNVYVADTSNGRVRKVSNGTITTVAGNGVIGFGGDNGPATNANLYNPTGLAVDPAGNLYIADSGNNRVRKVSNGVITTVAGNGFAGFSGDQGSGTSAQLNSPGAVAIDAAGNIYVADEDNNRVRKISKGVITTVAGNGDSNLTGDGGAATSAALGSPSGIAVDSSGNLIIAVMGGLIRRVSNGVITTVAGTGTAGFSGDNSQAVTAQLNGIISIAVGPSNDIYIADMLNFRVRKISGGIISTVAGNGVANYSGDNGPALNAQLNQPVAIASTPSGDLYVSDGGSRVRKISHSIITTIAGNGVAGYSGDNKPAVDANVAVSGIALDTSGNVYLAEGNRIRKITNGIIATVAGNGTAGFSGDNGPATSAQLNSAQALAVGSNGDLYIADTANYRIRKVSNGVITTIAGSGVQGYGGDLGSATAAKLDFCSGVAVSPSGDVYISDMYNNRIRKVSNGVITTVAGNGIYQIQAVPPSSPATSAYLPAPTAVSADASNLFAISAGVVNRVSGDIITTVAGTGMTGFSGDGGPATKAQLSFPMGLATDSAGNVYIADTSNNRVRMLTPSSCSYSVSQANFQVPVAGSNLATNIQTGPSCVWQVANLPAWIKTAGTWGSGPAVITLVVAPNPGTVRNAMISIGGVSVNVYQDGTALSTITSITNGASFQAGPVSPGEMVTIKGTMLGPSVPVGLALDKDGKVSTQLGGVQVLFSGWAAPLIYVSANQINAVVPYEIDGVTSLYVAVKYQGQTSNILPLTASSAVPALFTFDSSGTGPVAALNPDGTYNSQSNPAPKGSYIVLYVTGEGQIVPAGVTGKVTVASAAPPYTPQPVQPVSVTIGGQPAFVAFYGEAPTFVSGVMQLNVEVPRNVPSGDLPLVVLVGPTSSQNGVTVSVQ